MIQQNIPHELRELQQWVAAGSDKAPLNPRTGQAASVTDPSTWGTFQEAVQTGFRHIGFVLSASDPYSIIDLDDPETIKVNGVVMPNPDLAQVAEIGARHKAIFNSVESYAELSQSGKGVHLIVRGSVPHGVRRDKVEIYSDSRYMICTGNILKNLPIADHQALLELMFEKMEEGTVATVPLVQVASHLSDDELFAMASTAANADKFNTLWQGQWQGNPQWPSQSEADFALMAMLGFYSPDNEQCRRMFRYSALGKRSKATKNNSYLNYALEKVRAKTPPQIDFSALFKTQADPVANAVADRGAPPSPIGVEPTSNGADSMDKTSDLETESENQTNRTVDASPIAYPPGFVGQLAEYIEASAIRPVREIALCAAIALTAGVVGRAFNISGTGLNQYLLVLAKTGSGKEGASTGIDQLVTAARATVPMIDEFIGPGAFASGQGLVRVLDKNPCFVSILGEFGLTLNQICSPNANGAQVMLKKVLLDIYAKSGWSKTLRSSVYSDTDKNTKSIRAPNVTIFGESNPEKFYEGIDAGIISEGLLPRFSVFEYTGPRPPKNPNAFAPPSEGLVRSFSALAAVAMAAQTQNACSPVQQDREALTLLDAFDDYATKEINGNEVDINRQLWNRAHLKALKMAALIAVGVNPHQPIINKTIAEWAINMIRKDIATLLAKFDNGEVGSGDVRLEFDVRRAVSDYLNNMKPWDRRAYGCPEKAVTFPVIPFGYLRRRCRSLVNFRTDRRGANRALEETLKSMVDAEVLQRVSHADAFKFCGCTAPVYVKGSAF